MSSEIGSRIRHGAAFWRAHHEAWQHSELNQREHCEAQGIPLKAFGNWRTRFKAEPQPPSPKLLSRPVQSTGSIESHAILGGLHHHYARAYVFGTHNQLTAKVFSNPAGAAI